MLRSSCGPYPRWRSLAHNHNLLWPRTTIITPGPSNRLQSPYRTPGSRRPLTTVLRPAAESPSPSPVSKNDGSSVKPPRVPIRTQFKQWLQEHQETFESPAQAPPPDTSPDDVNNAVSRTQGTGSLELNMFHQQDDAGLFTVNESQPLEVEGEARSIESTSRNPGDMVELRWAGSRAPVLAVYLGHIGGLNHFFGNNGRWITSLTFASRFAIPGFATAVDLAPLIKKIPPTATSEELEELRQHDLGPSISDAQLLLRKIKQFETDSQKVYHANISRLDKAQTLLFSFHKSKYLSLWEIANLLLPATLKQNGEFLPTALYAVHLALGRYEVGFYPLSPSLDSHRRDHIYEILSQTQMSSMETVIEMVRKHCQNLTFRRGPPISNEELESTELGSFILKARQTVNWSRSRRQWAPGHMIRGHGTAEELNADWSTTEADILGFLEQWAVHGIFLDSSPYHSYGSLLLRFLNLYPHANLDQRTAWTFLQEIGWIQPWEIPSRYKLRLPGTRVIRGGGLQRHQPEKLSKSMLGTDRAASYRHDWGSSPVFCIDGRSTVVIDDGVSLERTETKGEYWIHVHAADPASVVQPHSELAEFLELIPESVYLPGHFQAMLPSELGESDTGDYSSDALVTKFSLRSGSPTLTFSARVNDQGKILDYKVQPGSVDNVIYLDPEDVSQFCNEPSPPHSTKNSPTIEVGKRPPEEPLNRDMTLAKDLQDGYKEDLLILSRLSQALHAERLAKGAWPYFPPQPSVLVKLPTLPPPDGSPYHQHPLQNPYIKVSQDSFAGSSLVTNCMILAGQIAARWCSSRGIPLPYRKNSQPAGDFRGALEYAEKELYPLIRNGAQPSSAQRAELTQRTGAIELSTTPGPYFIMGIDMYAKATSPLRRFGDLIVHWQIHAVLAWEQKNGRKIDAGVDIINSIIPFSTKTLPNTIALLETREKMCRLISRGVHEWILMALYRAWKWDMTLPATLRFTVGNKWRRSLSGTLDLFDLSATLAVGDLDNCVLFDHVQPGDHFEVELVDINVVNRGISVKALRYLPRNAEQISHTTESSPDTDAKSSGFHPPMQSPALA